MKHCFSSIINRYSHKNSRLFLLDVTLAFLLFSLGGCSITKSIDDIINEVDKTRKTIAGESSAWRLRSCRCDPSALANPRQGNW